MFPETEEEARARRSQQIVARFEERQRAGKSQQEKKESRFVGGFVVAVAAVAVVVFVAVLIEDRVVSRMRTLLHRRRAMQPPQQFDACLLGHRCGHCSRRRPRRRQRPLKGHGPSVAIAEPVATALSGRAVAISATTATLAVATVPGNTCADPPHVQHSDTRTAHQPVGQSSLRRRRT